MATFSDASDDASDRRTPVEEPLDRISTLRPPPLERTAEEWNLLLASLGMATTQNVEVVTARRFGLPDEYLPFLCEIRTAIESGDGEGLIALYHLWIGAT